MKRFVIYFLSLFTAVAILAVVVDQLNVWLIRSSSGNTAYKMERLYTNPEPDEIAIVGSSRACENFVPSIISPRCFNYGVGGMTMDEIISILEVLQRRQSTSPVIVNLDPWGCFGTGSVVANYRLAPQSGRLKFLDRIPGIRFFGGLRSNLVDLLNDRRSVSTVIDHGAKLLKTSRAPEEWKTINAKIGGKRFIGDPESERHFIQVLSSFAPRRVYLVICPCSSVWKSKFIGQKELSVLLARVRGLQNTVVLDYYGSSDFSDNDFMDPTHFNISGARRFSNILKKDIQLP